MSGIGKYKRKAKGKRGFRMKSPFRIDLIRKTGLGPRANPNVAQGEDAQIEALNDKCMEKGMVWSEGKGKCVKKVVAKESSIATKKYGMKAEARKLKKTYVKPTGTPPTGKYTGVRSR